jgi:acyl dehydratase
MAIDYQQLKNKQFPDVVQTYTAKDCILYALGLGLGADPLDPDQLRFVYEDGLRMLPTMPVVLGSPGFWIKNEPTGIDWKAVLHGEQGLTIHRLPATEGTVVSRLRIEEIVDKGPGKGALIYSVRELRDRASGELLASLTSTSFCRADGGFGGPSGPTRAAHAMPERAPDIVCDITTLPQAALIYRLSGDYNPLHADPAIAGAAGFKQPILQGLCSYGVAGHALLKALCDYDPARLQRMDLRFSAPVYPGETIRTEIWRDAPGRASFRARALQRDLVVLNNGLLEYRA